MRAAILVFGVLVAVLALGRGADRANAVGEGVFQLDKTAYSTPEGTAVLVTIQRTDGGTLTNDVKVILAVDGTTEFDIPSAEATKLLTFPKGSNLSSLPVFIQTLNKEQFVDRNIQVTILSVDNGGLIGARSTAPITLLGSGTPRVFGITPDSGGGFLTEGTILTVTGENFIVDGATINSTVTAVQFWLPFANSAEAEVTAPNFEVISPTELHVKVPPLGANYVPSLNLAAATYDVRIVVTPDPAQTPPTDTSPITIADKFVHTSGPTVTNLSVRQGPPTGGTQLLVTGTQFFGTPNAVCPLNTVTFGGFNVTSCKYVTADSILVTSPARSSGPVFVIVNNVANACTTHCGYSPPVPDAAFTYQGLPVITGLNPSFGPQSGGNTVEIFGSNFLTNNTLPTKVLFGGNEATFLVVNDNKIIATAPAGSGVQQVSIVHPVSGTSEFRTEANYSYSSGPLINSIDPAHGPSSGGSVVTIRGTGFAAGASVKFGDIPAFSSVVSATEITATAPPGSGIVQISVTLNGTVSSPGPESLFSYDGPAVTSINPIAGPPAGGTAIVIRGNNFTTASVVSIGGIVVPSVFVDPTTLTASTPPVTSPMAAHVRVTTGSGQSAESAADVFTYTNGPIVDSINPDNGPTTGASIVVLTGKNFAAPLSITFGGVPATSFNVNSATQITVLSPSNPVAAPVDVVVTKGTDVSPIGPNTKFTYLSAVPVVTAIAPNTGSTFGGTDITITGVGFTGAACPGSVKFGAVDAATCSVINDTTLTTTAPPNVAGPTVVVVQTANGTSQIVPNYTYVSPSGPGGGTSEPAPSTPGVTTYTLAARWTLLTWTGMADMSVSDAVHGTGVPGGTDLSGRISALYLWDAQTSTYKAYFTGAEAIPGANDFNSFTTGAVYWVAILGTGQVPWVVKTP
ncbi:MAG: IPT/TIG domain-containing protein [Dehalococcoidia bacterium]